MCERKKDMGNKSCKSCVRRLEFRHKDRDTDNSRRAFVGSPDDTGSGGTSQVRSRFELHGKKRDWRDVSVGTFLFPLSGANCSISVT